LKAIREQLVIGGKRLPLVVVVYTGQISPRALQHLEQTDQITMWTWDPAHLKEDIEGVSRTLLALKAWFSPDLTAWNEKEFVGSGGEMIRVDRIVKEQSRYIVIDYKTGSPNPRYHNQIKRYLKILRPLEGPVEGVLAYLDSGEVEHVRS